jgi:hypothetical protein
MEAGDPDLEFLIAMSPLTTYALSGLGPSACIFWLMATIASENWRPMAEDRLIISILSGSRPMHSS